MSSLTPARDGALAMAQRGLPVFRVAPNSKVPYRSGINEATTDPAVINRWFDEAPDLNYGISMRGRVALDVDPRKDADRWFEELSRLGHLPDTLTTITPTGGMHYVYDRFEASQRPLSPCIDVRSNGGYIVGPGSVIDGKRYRIHKDLPLASVPAHLAAQLSRPGEKAADNSTPAAELDTPGAIAYAEDVVRRTPCATLGNRNAALYRLACVLKDKGVSYEHALPLLLEEWCPRCDPPYEDEAQIEKSVASAYNNGQRQPGIEAPEIEFDDLSNVSELIEWEARRRKAPKPVQSLLERFSDIRLDDIVARQSNALVKGVLHHGDAAVLYGESKAGKSFIGLDLAWHLAMGKPWHGRKVNQAPVLYVALEGVQGFQKRMLAAGKVHGDPGPWFARLNLHVSLVKADAGKQGMAKILEAAKQLAAETGQPVGAVVIDTFARATAGDDENATDAVMHFVDNRAGAIARATGAAVITVAHTNRAGDLRGSLHLRNAMDVVLKAERADQGRKLIGEKIKDGPECILFDYTLEEVHLGEDEDGEAVTSCVLRSTPAKPKTEAVDKTKAQRRFRAAYDKVRATTPHGDALLSDVRDAFVATVAVGETDKEKASKAKRNSWSRAMDDLPMGLEIVGEYVRAVGTTSPLDEFEPIMDAASQTSHTVSMRH